MESVTTQVCIALLEDVRYRLPTAGKLMVMGEPWSCLSQERALRIPLWEVWLNTPFFSAVRVSSPPRFLLFFKSLKMFLAKETVRPGDRTGLSQKQGWNQLQPSNQLISSCSPCILYHPSRRKGTQGLHSERERSLEKSSVVPFCLCTD